MLINSSSNCADTNNKDNNSNNNSLEITKNIMMHTDNGLLIKERSKINNFSSSHKLTRISFRIKYRKLRTHGGN